VSASISALIPEMQPFARELVRAAGAAGLMPRITSTLRSRAEQTRLYRRYLSGLQTLPVAAPGTSAHEFGFALDMIVTPYDALADVGDFWKGMGGVWGGAFNDPVHFEYPGFKTALESAPLRAASSDEGFGGTFGEFADLVDFAASFIGKFGSIELASEALGFLLPQFKESTLFKMLEHPTRYSPQWLLVSQLLNR
jgi:D-alanyl-D-alanine carboxypeptidase-like protein